MANDLTKNPFIIDTASGAVLTTCALKIVSIRWVNASAAADQATVKDKNGKVMWNSVASGTNFGEDSSPFVTNDSQFVDGLIVDVLSSGKLYIYYE